MNFIQRIRNIIFWSGISKEATVSNPHSFVQKHIAELEIKGHAYIAGLSDEEQAFANSLNINNKDTKLT